MAGMSSTPTPVFEALIVPHRSLSSQGLRTIVCVLMSLSVAVAVRFWLWGAWPVVLFSLVEVPLLGLLLAINQRRARASELIMLDNQALTVIRTDSVGRRQQQSLPAAWLRVELETGRGIPRILLNSRGRACEVGGFLHEPDRLSLFATLKDALYRLNNPRFDNPQLQDP